MSNKINFLSFLKKYKWLFAVMLAILILPIILFCFIFRDNLFDISSWASIVSGIVTYICSALLSIIVFYNSWVQIQINNRLDEINIKIEPIFNFNKNYITFLCKDECILDDSNFIVDILNPNINSDKTENFFGIKVYNLNPFMPIVVTIEGIYYVNSQNQIEKCSSYSKKTDIRYGVSIDNKREATYYFGITDDIIPLDYRETIGVINLFIVLKITTQKGLAKYYLEDYYLTGSLGVNKKIMTEKEYRKNIDKFGLPIAPSWPNKQSLIQKRKHK